MRKGINMPVRFSRESCENARVHTDVSKFQASSPTPALLHTLNTEAFENDHDYLNGKQQQSIDKNVSTDTIVADYSKIPKSNSQFNSPERFIYKGDESKENDYPKNGVEKTKVFSIGSEMELSDLKNP